MVVGDESDLVIARAMEFGDILSRQVASEKEIHILEVNYVMVLNPSSNASEQRSFHEAWQRIV